MARPSKFTQALADEICERIANGEPLAQICREGKMPGVTTVWDWERKHTEFSESIARARLAGYDQIAADALLIANTPVKGIRTKVGKDGTEVTEEDMLGHRKLQVETRLKLLAKWDPKRYGDRLNVDGMPEHGAVSLTVNIQSLPALQAGYKQFREALAYGRN